MITEVHQLSELISMYKSLANMYDEDAHTKAAEISNYLTEKNLIKSLSSLSVNTVLDAGGGTGKWSLFLSEHGYDVTMMDASQEMIDISMDKMKYAEEDIKVIKGDIENTSFANNSFDLVMAEGGVISLTPNPAEMLKEFARITKTGGYIWIDYLNLLGWSLLQPDVETRLQLAGKEEESIYMGKNEYPFRLFSPRKLRNMLYDFGFLELNEFGNGILTNPMMSNEKIKDSDFENLKKAELELSRNYNLNGSAFHIQVLAQKIIY